MKKLRLILGDQLNSQHSWFRETDSNVIYCIFEMRQETDYVTHHIQKVTGFFAAMRNFAKELKIANHAVIYFNINDKKNTQSLVENLTILIEENNIEKFEYLSPDEYRLDQQIKIFCKNLPIDSRVFSSEHFYTEREDLETFFKGKKQFLMENFYRNMRKKHQILMIDKQPEGGKWNYDASNRKKWKGDTLIPQEINFDTNVEDILSDIKKAKIETIGKINSKYFEYPISRKQAIQQLNYFCEHLLVHFGDYQDAMHTDKIYLFHSRISFAMNTKIISPKEIIDTVLETYRKQQDAIDISQVEGFIRQILGWREYMRGMYWMLMPEYKKENFLDNKNKLPKFFWTGKTKMNCLKNAINNSLENGYAHHIQRLMITGNFALLTQIHPDEIDAWYLGIYVDAIEWVQLPNTRGMSQFADGGKIATKPYVSSGSYISKMSNYCESCVYKKAKKFEDDACPFNTLYWNFLDEKQEKLSSNFRMKMMYSLLNKMSSEDRARIKEKANHIIENLDEY
ncbi:deoxyribodipyrimidine photolyase-related protein [Polaribacter sp. Hel1_33_78]|jgi:deoxyribodipyrimidine photolyase-related protein|uniref:cryptochrome/photolyase family protein n=1 Tax=Polaribacter sp. Hel1_33_78 TaxID=1336804 RepID=UPI000879A9DA|nr:cryptochrome/photolyase family protein [Polaribacter sp. Hel1_33_78]MBT4413660.1 cryptochrome/photolyase family protein [Polaribacter sp.]SDT95994.1 deoxyribodipyrimidine photolyase-related protein [Polaribacter sp. Hel1_33_78]